MFSVTGNESGNYAEFLLEGKLTREAYREFVPMVEQQIAEHGKLRMVVVMHDFKGWEMGAAWEDIKFDSKHFGDLERLAMVGDKEWEKWMTFFCRPFTTAKVKYFDLANVDDARAWVLADRIPLHHQLVREDGILILHPEDPLTKDDLLEVSDEIDQFIEEYGNLNGVLIEAKKFPGWSNFSSMLTHFKFIRNHHRELHRVAIVSDDDTLSKAPGIANHFVAAEVKHFPFEQRAEAREWVSQES